MITTSQIQKAETLSTQVSIRMADALMAILQSERNDLLSVRNQILREALSVPAAGGSRTALEEIAFQIDRIPN